jgi:hypothetical protein
MGKTLKTAAELEAMILDKSPLIAWLAWVATPPCLERNMLWQTDVRALWGLICDDCQASWAAIARLVFNFPIQRKMASSAWGRSKRVSAMTNKVIT